MSKTDIYNNSNKELLDMRGEDGRELSCLFLLDNRLCFILFLNNLSA